MEVVVTGRHVRVSERFRAHLDDKLAKVSQLVPAESRVDVVVTHERGARTSECVEVTCHAKSSVIRAEACADDKHAALDAAVDKLVERLRRAHDRRRVARTGRRVPESVARATGRVQGVEVGTDPGGDGSADDGPQDAAPFGAVGDSPIEVREKVHASAPMTLEEALKQMELVGHDFFLFQDVDTDRASVVYRRRGWSYGVIHLDVETGVGEAV
ncbi:MAG: ribosome hibernation-promoting factor, HPF/YfiA family [Lapillicoccus sp.]